MLSDKAKILMLEKIKPFLNGDYRDFINEEIKGLTPKKPKIEIDKGDPEYNAIICPKCGELVCFAYDIENWKEIYDFSIEAVIYCPMCRQAIDIDEIANKKMDCDSERKE